MIDDFDILLAEYVVALANDSVTVEMRRQIFDTVNRSYGMLMKVADVIVSHCKRCVIEEVRTVDEAIALSRSEYIAIGFSTIVQYKFLAPVVEMFIDGERFADFSDEDKIGRIRSIYESNLNNPNEVLKRAVNIYCLRALLRYRAYLLDTNLIQEIVSIVNQYTREEKDAAILPASIMDSM